MYIIKSIPIDQTYPAVWYLRVLELPIDLGKSYWTKNINEVLRLPESFTRKLVRQVVIAHENEGFRTTVELYIKERLLRK